MSVPSAPYLYAIALGSNRSGRAGRPRGVLRAAVAALAELGAVRAVSPIVETAPLGPSTRRFANAAALVAIAAPPDAVLAALKAIEARFGRRPGRRWGARVLDLDLILWSGGAWVSPGLVIPHPAWRTRDFVLGPLAAIAPDWRDPVSGRTVRQLARPCTGARSGYVRGRVGP
ncbi:MAG: 2-amino-4-hydroxy-6-hydroxymethyldihydropteridine diphosphokinase [Sphingomonas sp.]|uniref:2-amino-4-hydroxy-6- hydroxymethyldihydropteridine diphosphokinase n=1 Tax=Sphingomonas sp. TaxID=28214 RepID=UPI0025D8E8B8|nr:2-amino-4-hydroxy-6-hydroxymethyldihydropteridine diphosphokinase [Sphingomonas sp.]MBX9880592.1 2-amino-4-hydroxy-6-hydroxymethyldihydropteridine diphosphokinase [Sphingomonas sp.]